MGGGGGGVNRPAKGISFFCIQGNWMDGDFQILNPFTFFVLIGYFFFLWFAPQQLIIYEFSLFDLKSIIFLYQLWLNKLRILIYYLLFIYSFIYYKNYFYSNNNVVQSYSVTESKVVQGLE